jgi:hypothetical protein
MWRQKDGVKKYGVRMASKNGIREMASFPRQRESTLICQSNSKNGFPLARE